LALYCYQQLNVLNGPPVVWQRPFGVAIDPPVLPAQPEAPLPPPTRQVKCGCCGSACAGTEKLKAVSKLAVPKAAAIATIASIVVFSLSKLYIR